MPSISSRGDAARAPSTLRGSFALCDCYFALFAALGGMTFAKRHHAFQFVSVVAMMAAVVHGAQRVIA